MKLVALLKHSVKIFVNDWKVLSLLTYSTIRSAEKLHFCNTFSNAACTDECMFVKQQSQREHMSSAAESKEPEVGEMDVIGGLFEAKPGQKYPTPSPGNGGTFLCQFCYITSRH